MDRRHTDAILIFTASGTVEKALFSITCTTCQARLAVRSKAAVGAILECPKCTSMVQVVPPVDWKAEPEPAQQAGETPDAGQAGPAGQDSLVGAGADAESPGPAGVPASPAELLWRKWLLLGTVPVAGLVLVLGAWSMFFSPGKSGPPSTPVAEEPAEPAPSDQPTPPEEEPEPVPDEIDQSQAPPASSATEIKDHPASQADSPAAVGDAEGSVGFPSQYTDPGAAEQAATSNENQEAPVVPYHPEPELPQLEFDPPEPEAAKPEGVAEKPEPDADISRADPPAGLVEKPLLPKVDVEARLADTIPEIELREMPLSEAIELLAELSTLPISFDPEALSQLGVTLEDPVTVELSQATVGRILQTVVSSRGLASVVENGQVLITVPPDKRETLRKRPYTISDLTGSDPAAVAEMAALVQKLVSPDSWRQRGGPGTIQPDGGTLVVTQTEVVHHQILVFCEKLRNARGMPLRSSLDRDRFTLATRRDRAKQTLGLPVTVNFHEPAPLVQIVNYLEELTGADILIDRPALGAAGVSAEADATLKVRNQPLAVALDELLRPLGLAYRATEMGPLQVSTSKSVAARLELEFYPVAELLADGQTGPALVQRIKGHLAGSTWSDAGGPGVLHFDPPGNCLIVLQSQPVQAALEKLLAELASQKPAVAGQ